MLIMPSLTLIAWKLRSNWTLFYPICGMFCCLKVRWENLVTFCEVRLSWHKVSILSKLELHPELPSGSNDRTLEFVVHLIRPRRPWRDVADLGEGHVRQIQSGIVYSAGHENFPGFGGIFTQLSGS